MRSGGLVVGRAPKEWARAPLRRRQREATARAGRQSERRWRVVARDHPDADRRAAHGGLCRPCAHPALSARLRDARHRPTAHCGQRAAGIVIQPRQHPSAISRRRSSIPDATAVTIGTRRRSCSATTTAASGATSKVTPLMSMTTGAPEAENLPRGLGATVTPAASPTVAAPARGAAYRSSCRRAPRCRRLGWRRRRRPLFRPSRARRHWSRTSR